jgi:hypothetical protein
MVHSEEEEEDVQWVVAEFLTTISSLPFSSLAHQEKALIYQCQFLWWKFSLPGPISNCCHEVNQLTKFPEN